MAELRINPEPFDRYQTKDSINHGWPFCQTYFVGIKFSRVEQKPLDLRSTVQKFALMLDLNRYNKQDSNCRIMHYERDQLPQTLL